MSYTNGSTTVEDGTASILSPTLAPSAQPTSSTHNVNRTMATDVCASFSLEASAPTKTNTATKSDGPIAKAPSWSDPGRVAFDLRSDVVTVPTARMLSAIASTSLMDDVFQQDPSTIALEAWIAELTGKEASLLVLSGTMGNQVSIRTHLQGPPHSVVCDCRSHLFACETGGVASLCGALTIPIEPSNGRFLTLEDVRARTVISDDVVSCPTKLISLENTLGGVIMPLEECRRISTWARDNKITVHLDGARLWEAVAAGAGSLREYCECFDSISLCFSKGLGAPIGSIIVGSQAFRERARWVRKSIGGGLRQSGVVSAAARVAVEDSFPRKLQASHQRAVQVADTWKALGGQLSKPVETNMVWLDLAAAGVSLVAFIRAGEEYGLQFMTERLVIHYQVSEEALQRLEKLMRVVLGSALQT